MATTLQAGLEAQGATMAVAPFHTLPGSALPRPGGAEAKQTCLGPPLTVQPPPAELADPQEPAAAPETLPASEQTGAAYMQTSSEVSAKGVLPPGNRSTPQHPLIVAGSTDGTVDMTEPEPSQSAGQACRPEDADGAPAVAEQTEKADTPVEALRETATQSSLAASVSASILAGDGLSQASATKAAAPACHSDDSQDPAGASTHVASGLVGSHASLAPSMKPAHADISRPVGQAEASKLLGIRDDLDQLGPGQPDVPCCGRKGSHAGHPAGVPEEAHPEQGSLVDGTDTGSAQQQSAEQIAADLPLVGSAEQPSNLGTSGGAISQCAAEQAPQHYLEHMAPTDGHQNTRSVTTQHTKDAPDLRLSQQSLLPAEIAPHTTAPGAQLAAPAAEVSMHAASPSCSSEAIPADSSAAMSEPGVGQCDVMPDQDTGAAQPAASIGPSQDIPVAEHPAGSLPPPVPLEAGFDCRHMQQPITPRLFDPTAVLGKAQSPALVGLSEHSSPPRTTPEGEALHPYLLVAAAIHAAEHQTPCIIRWDIHFASMPSTKLFNCAPCHLCLYSQYLG